MSRKVSKDGRQAAWVGLNEALQLKIPHAASWFNATDDFRELRLKARDDGTILAIAKGYDSDGGPIVSFGVGYDVSAALLALDATINGGHWRIDKPWQPKSK